MFKKILHISRPRFWLYTAGPFILGISTAENVYSLVNFQVIYSFFYFLIPANIFIYAVNDFFDRNIDTINPKKHIREVYMKLNDTRLYKVLVTFSILLGLPLLSLNSISAATYMLFMFMGFFYSVPPIRFKTKPFFDSLSNFFYILPGIISYSLLFNTIPPIKIVMAGSLWAIAMHLFSAIIDIESDKKAGIKTTAVFLGYKRSLLLTSLLWFSSIALVIDYSIIIVFGLMYPLLPILVFIKKYKITDVYWSLPLINCISGMILFFTIIYGK